MVADIVAVAGAGDPGAVTGWHGVALDPYLHAGSVIERRREHATLPP
jgi:hypothetical protein